VTLWEVVIFSATKLANLILILYFKDGSRRSEVIHHFVGLLQNVISWNHTLHNCQRTHKTLLLHQHLHTFNVIDRYSSTTYHTRILQINDQQRKHYHTNWQRSQDLIEPSCVQAVERRALRCRWVRSRGLLPVDDASHDHDRTTSRRTVQVACQTAAGTDCKQQRQHWHRCDTSWHTMQQLIWVINSSSTSKDVNMNCTKTHLFLDVSIEIAKKINSRQLCHCSPVNLVVFICLHVFIYPRFSLSVSLSLSLRSLNIRLLRTLTKTNQSIKMSELVIM